MAHKQTLKKNKAEAVLQEVQLPVKQPLAIFIVLGLALAIFSPAFNNQLVNWDDYAYITENTVIQSLSWANIKHIFKLDTFVVGNYHPLTVLTLALEYHIAGAKPFIYHFNNVLLHLCNSLLVYFICKKLNLNNFAATCVFALFALHPMRVESVVWAAERKDVLYAFFFFASMLSYLQYLQTNAGRFYFFSLSLFLFSCLSKGQAVVLPLLLLLIDWKVNNVNRKALLNKIPFFLLSIIFGIVAIQAQHTSLTSARLNDYVWWERIFYASTGLVQYSYHLFAPFDLACFYQYPIKSGGLYPWYIYASLAVALALFYFAYRYSKGNKNLQFGILFFLISVFPVLQLLPVGDAIAADRYTYIPYFGLFFTLIVFLQKKIKQTYWRYGFLLFIVLMCYLSLRQSAVWKNNETLWTDVIKKYPKTAVAYNNRGVHYINEGKLEKAKQDVEKAVSLRANYFEAWNNVGNVLGKLENKEGELEAYNQALNIAPGYTIARFNRGLAYERYGQHDLAIADYKQVAIDQPTNERAYYSIGLAEKSKKNYPAAIVAYEKAIALNPNFTDAYNNLGNVYYDQREYTKALNLYSRVLGLDPGNANAYFNRSACYYNQQNYKLALQDAEKAKQLGHPVDDQYLQILKQGLGL